VRLFQNCRYYPSLRPRPRELAKAHSTFAGQVAAFVDFRQNGAHTLLPVDQHAEWAFAVFGIREGMGLKSPASLLGG
jgi:hypothetical protein